MRFAASNPKLTEFLGGGPSYGDVGDMAMRARGQEKSKAHEADAYAFSSGLDALGKVKAAEAAAPGIVAGGMAQGAASQAQGMSGMMSGIAGGISNMSFGGGTFSYAGGPGSSGTALGAGGGNVGGYGTLGPNYGIYQG